MGGLVTSHSNYFQNISFLDDCFDAYGSIYAQCPSQICNLHIQCQRIGVRVIAPYLVEYRFTLHKLVLMVCQQPQYLCLSGGNDYPFVTLPQFVFGIREHNRADRNSIGIACRLRLLHFVYHVLQELLPKGIYPFLEHNSPDEIIEAASQDCKEQDTTKQLPEHGL